MVVDKKKHSIYNNSMRLLLYLYQDVSFFTFLNCFLLKSLVNVFVEN